MAEYTSHGLGFSVQSSGRCGACMASDIETRLLWGALKIMRASRLLVLERKRICLELL